MSSWLKLKRRVGVGSGGASGDKDKKKDKKDKDKEKKDKKEKKEKVKGKEKEKDKPKKLEIGPPRNFKQLGHIADTEGRLKGFGIGAQKTMMIGDQVIGGYGLLHKLHKRRTSIKLSDQNSPKQRHQVAMRMVGSRRHQIGAGLRGSIDAEVSLGLPKNDTASALADHRRKSRAAALMAELDMLGGHGSTLDSRNSTLRDIELDEFDEDQDMIGVQDQTYRHSWPNKDVIISVMEGGRNESENSMRDAVFQFKDLEMSDTIAEGFFGRVYIATNKRTREKVVVKELKESDHDAQLAFIQEVALLKCIAHPNLLLFLGLFVATSTDSNESLNMVTEFIAGGTLEDAVEGKKEHFQNLSWETRIKWALELADGLGYLHSKHLIHRDVKPANCLIREAPDLSLVLCDFGLARIMDGEVLRDDKKEGKQLGGQVRQKEVSSESNNQNANQLGTPGGRMGQRAMTVRGNDLSKEVTFEPRRMSIVGTVDYMAPELAMNMEYNETVDVFSFAIVLACGLIARKEADPDEFRSIDFGLNIDHVRSQYGKGCPPGLLAVAGLAGAADATKRPAFPKIMARLRVVRLKLPMELAAAESLYAAAGSKSDGPAVVTLKPKRQAFIELLLDDYGDEIQGTAISREKIDATIAKHGCSQPRWFLQDTMYQQGDDFVVPVIRTATNIKPVSKLPQKKADFLDLIAKEYGGSVREVTRKMVMNAVEKNGAKMPRWFLQDTEYLVDANNPDLFKLPEDGLEEWRNKEYPSKPESKLPQKKVDFLDLIAKEYGGAVRQVTKQMVIQAVEKHSAKTPRWFLQDKEYLVDASNPDLFVLPEDGLEEWREKEFPAPAIESASPIKSIPTSPVSIVVSNADDDGGDTGTPLLTPVMANLEINVFEDLQSAPVVEGTLPEAQEDSSN